MSWIKEYDDQHNPLDHVRIWETPETLARYDDTALKSFRSNPPHFLTVSAKENHNND